MRFAWPILGALVLAGAIFMGTQVIGQIHHDNRCSQYANALRGSLDDPATKPDDLGLLPANVRVAVVKSRATFNSQASVNDADWQNFVDQFTAEALAQSGC